MYEDIESYLLNKEKSFELEKRSLLQHNASFKEKKKSRKGVGTSCFRYKET